jgi:hypothetical protein
MLEAYFTTALTTLVFDDPESAPHAAAPSTVVTLPRARWC